MSGHSSNVLALELSQYGLLSGSMDTKVKVCAPPTVVDHVGHVGGRPVGHVGHMAACRARRQPKWVVEQRVWAEGWVCLSGTMGKTWWHAVIVDAHKCGAPSHSRSYS